MCASLPARVCWLLLCPLLCQRCRVLFLCAVAQKLSLLFLHPLSFGVWFFVMCVCCSVPLNVSSFFMLLASEVSPENIGVVARLCVFVRVLRVVVLRCVPFFVRRALFCACVCLCVLPFVVCTVRGGRSDYFFELSGACPSLP